MNVAYHLQNLGAPASMISQVGKDPFGDELLGFLQKHGIETEFIATDQKLPTGTVHVQLDKKGIPSYEIASPVAWDNIQSENEKLDSVKEADALVFGSLACRSEQSKRTLLELAKVAPFRVFDVNLRAPFYSKPIIETLLPVTDVLKLNDDELNIIAGWYLSGFTEESAMKFLMENFGLETVIVTKGREGAVCLKDGKLYRHPGFSVKVTDTVGSGDAFLAALLKKMFDWEGMPFSLEFACAMGALVATHKGGTPRITEEMVLHFMQGQKTSTSV